MELSCTGKLDFDVTVLMQLNTTVNTSKNITVLNFKRRKMCHKSKLWLFWFFILQEINLQTFHRIFSIGKLFVTALPLLNSSL